ESLARLAAEPSMPASAVQLVVRHSSFPGPTVDPQSMVARSYQELTGTLAVPPQRDIWIAVRVGLADAAGWGAGLPAVHGALGAAATRIGAMLTATGLEHRLLDTAGLQAALADAYGPDPFDGVPQKAPRTAKENWSRWQAARAGHICFRVTGWP